ncbi:hypothetical protein C0993_000056 [Termitomyces sp. T159_Od127]|nr:hypothetical protein C0993_000056 [Termitomyces sp. T159_Od127]
MAEKDATARFRRAVKENNLFLVKRLIQRTDMRNIDPSTRRYTSLAWAAVLGHEETFEFLLTSGHDDKELSKDSEDNTILMLLADHRPPNVYAEDSSGATLRMARLYYDRYPDVLDWANAQGRTALHIAAIKGNEELVRDTARLTVENNKKSRKNLLHAQALADRGNDWNGTSPIPVPPPNLPSRHRDTRARMRSSSGTSRSTTTTSDFGDLDSNGLATGLSQSSFSASSSPSQPSTGSNSYYHTQHLTSPMTATSSTLTFSGSSSTNQASSLNPPANSLASLSPIANRVRERDADARERYLSRNRSGSQGTSSTDYRSQNGSFFASAGPSANGDNITALNSVSNGGTSTPRRLRPSASAVQLRTVHTPAHTIHTLPESRHRAGTGSSQRSVSSALLTRSLSTSTSPRSMTPGVEESESYMGPPSQYAQFPEPPLPNEEETSTPVVQHRRKAFHILSKPLPPIDASINHRRGMSANVVRGA